MGVRILSGLYHRFESTALIVGYRSISGLNLLPDDVSRKLDRAVFVGRSIADPFLSEAFELYHHDCSDRGVDRDVLHDPFFYLGRRAIVLFIEVGFESICSLIRLLLAKTNGRILPIRIDSPVDLNYIDSVASEPAKCAGEVVRIHVGKGFPSAAISSLFHRVFGRQDTGID